MHDVIDLAALKAAAAPYSVGTPALIDSFGGVVRCRVEAVLREGYGFLAGGPHIRVRVTETKAGYTAGEVLERDAMYTPPVAHRVLRGYSYRINTAYKYVPQVIMGNNGSSA